MRKSNDVAAKMPQSPDSMSRRHSISARRYSIMSYDSLAAQAVELIKSALAEQDGHRRMLLLEEGLRLHRAAVEVGQILESPIPGERPN